MKWSWSLSLRLVYPVLHQPPGATITSRSAVRIRINFWRMVGLYISFEDWANALEKVSVLETGHTRYCSISGSDPLRQSYRLWHGYCRKTPTTTNKLFHSYRFWCYSVIIIISTWTETKSESRINPLNLIKNGVHAYSGIRGAVNLSSTDYRLQARENGNINVVRAFLWHRQSM